MQHSDQKKHHILRASGFKKIVSFPRSIYKLINITVGFYNKIYLKMKIIKTAMGNFVIAYCYVLRPHET